MVSYSLRVFRSVSCVLSVCLSLERVLRSPSISLSLAVSLSFLAFLVRVSTGSLPVLLQQNKNVSQQDRGMERVREGGREGLGGYLEEVCHNVGRR